ncbi:helix-turn-helix transcriptional regulator [uncultured Pontibacter sp.]|uniref:helix-turn-helix domain-containing protein n=1 Tax=uncultured Pontibacter sp. TaxID=453356 RepID=UPI00262F4FAB|nr:helix-turn-helix transcriptional regulator [uncultured Pontibacter sp.]
MVIKKIRNIRQQKGYSQEYMAHRLNISQNAYSKIERGFTDVTVKRIYEIAEILEISVFELLPKSNCTNKNHATVAVDIRRY